jgi:hypothetical protein
VHYPGRCRSCGLGRPRGGGNQLQGSVFHEPLLSLPHATPTRSPRPNPQLWLEGNPLAPTAVDALLKSVADGAAAPTLRALGIDEGQAAAADPGLLAAARAARPGLLRVGAVKGSGPGYFKLQRGGAAGDPPVTSSSAGSSDVDGTAAGSGGADGTGQPRERVLVVAFGSAPGLPNWGGVLRQVAATMEKDGGSRFVAGACHGARGGTRAQSYPHLATHPTMLAWHGAGLATAEQLCATRSTRAGPTCAPALSTPPSPPLPA